MSAKPSGAPDPGDHPPAERTPDQDPIAVLWDAHFREPAAAVQRARAVVDDARSDERSRAWAELVLGWHQLSFNSDPATAAAALPGAQRRFEKLGERRGELLARIGAARLALVRQQPIDARSELLAIYDEAITSLPPQDRFWAINALGATYYYEDRIDETIRYMHLALETLRTIDVSPHLATAMSNLAASLVTVGDYVPAKELARDALDMLPRYDNPQLWLFARSNLAEAELGTGDANAALATIDAMLSDSANPPCSAAQSHYLAIAAEVYALHGRFDDAERCVREAETIQANYPGGFNGVYASWAAAALADAREDDDTALAALDRAIDTAERLRHVPTLCKAYAAAARRLAALGRFEDAYRRQAQLTEVALERMTHRASAKYYLLKVEHELKHAREARDRAERERQESLAINRQLERLNRELERKVREVEELQSRLAAEAVHDPLTQLFNRRYLDSVVPALLSGANRRAAPLALALVDLDYFKGVNDRHGHLAGDRVLMQIGRVLATSLRPADVLCRYGGEEFCVVLPDTDGAGARTALATLATRLRELVVPWGDHALSGFTFSAGVAVAPDDGTTQADLVTAADRALYHAKGQGRERVVLARSDEDRPAA
ncbi:MAG: diguanylate cyclase [Betaproteobacteria bacterium]